VQPRATRLNEGAGLGGGIVVEHGGLRHIAMDKAHGMAVFKVDCGVKDHGAALALIGSRPNRTGGRNLQRATGRRNVKLA
jgi:hypothetical protein